MKATQNLQNRSPHEGWSIQVYSGDRRLLCSLSSGHLWMFFAGLVTGFLFAAAGFQAGRAPEAIPQSIDPKQADSEQSVNFETLYAPLAVD